MERRYDPIRSLVFVLFLLSYTASLERFVIPAMDSCESTQFHDISTAVVNSAHSVPLKYQDKPCYLRFAADSSAKSEKRLMLRFKHLMITDCRFKLRIYDGRSHLAHLLHEFSCDPKVSNDIIESSTMFFTIELNLGGAPASTFNFEIDITSFRSRKSSICHEFLCNNSKCINLDLKCNGFDNCLDGSDELHSTPSNCSRIAAKKLYKLNEGFIALIVVLVLLILIVLVLCVVCFFRRSHQSRNRPPPGVSTIMTTTAYHVAPTESKDVVAADDETYPQA